jgi:hypothetical protein
MSDLLEDVRQLKLRLGANEFLLRAVTIRVMLLDPAFAQDARQWIDHLLGQFSASERAKETDPQAFNAIREYYLRLLEAAENQARLATSVPQHKSIRRQIFEWLEQG